MSHNYFCEICCTMSRSKSRKQLFSCSSFLRDEFVLIFFSLKAFFKVQALCWQNFCSCSRQFWYTVQSQSYLNKTLVLCKTSVAHLYSCLFDAMFPSECPQVSSDILIYSSARIWRRLTICLSLKSSISSYRKKKVEIINASQHTPSST